MKSATGIACLSVAIACLAPTATSKPTYVVRIPNGNGVAGVNALGHQDPAGGGALNPFGRDFDELDERWTVRLCQMDSDGDGQTNGQELGDPCCQWQPGSNKPAFSTGVSHPGDAMSKVDEAILAKHICSTTPNPGGAGAAANHNNHIGTGSMDSNDDSMVFGGRGNNRPNANGANANMNGANGLVGGSMTGVNGNSTASRPKTPRPTSGSTMAITNGLVAAASMVVAWMALA